MPIKAEDLLVMELAPDEGDEPRLVTIQLMPAPFSQGWVENIRLLSRSEYYDGLAVIRVQDNYVTQWGDPADEEADAKPVPVGMKVMEESEYDTILPNLLLEQLSNPQNARIKVLLDSIEQKSAEELFANPPDIRSRRLFQTDPYARMNAWHAGWPIAIGPKEMSRPVGEPFGWPVHCYGMVGVARGMSPNTGDGSSLYTVIGHAPRHLGPQYRAGRASDRGDGASLLTAARQRSTRFLHR